MEYDAWKNFETSGKVEDYLNYCGMSVRDGQNERNVFSGKGTERYGNRHSSDRNGFKCNADWRV